MSEHPEEPHANEHVEDLAVPEGESDDVKGGLSLNFTKIEFKNSQKVQSPDVITGAGPGGGPH